MVDRRSRYVRAEMLIPGLAIKHKFAREDRELHELRTGQPQNPYAVRKRMLDNAYQEISGTKGLSRMAKADHKYKTGTHRLRLLERKL